MTEDRRFKRTDRILRECFAMLLTEKPLHTISVKELTDKADIHRSTFYAHYMDIYHLYHRMEEDLISEIHSIIEKDYHLNLAECYRLLTEYVYEHQSLSRLLFIGENSYSVIHLLTEEFHESCRCYWQRMLGVDCISKELDFTIRYHVQGCFALIRHWCENDFDLSIEAMTAMITNIDSAVTTYVKKTQDNKIGGGSYVVN